MENFQGKNMQKMITRITYHILDHYLNLVNSLKYSRCIQETPFQTRYFERGLSKILKKFNFIFVFEPIRVLLKL